MPSDRFVLDFDEPFDGDTLDTRRWLPTYLPHWSTWERAAARYALADGALHLLIESDQPPWCPEIDGELRVSSLQTGLFAGEPGSTEGQHQFDHLAEVRNGPHDIRLYTPQYGRFEVGCAASDDPRLMVAFWMIGLGDTPAHTGEICICEIFGTDVGAGHAAVGVGVHPHQDRRIVDDFERVRLPIDARQPHDYAAEWTPAGITFYIDGAPVKTVAHSPDYPMQLMLGIYEFPPLPGVGAATHDAAPYPKRFVVESVRGSRYEG